VPLSSSPAWVHDVYAFSLALLAFALVFGAFAAITLNGAMRAVPKAQIETAEAYGMTKRQAFRRVLLPQMWIFALPGLSNLWMILVKATPAAVPARHPGHRLLGARTGGSKTSFYTYPHPDWRLWYFLVVLVFYLAVTWVSERGFGWLMDRMSLGQDTAGGERLRRGRA
jgi:polar amino acid transport system permease protein